MLGMLSPGTYGMFHVTWATFQFNRNQLRTVSAYVMSSVPSSNQRAHKVINEKSLSKEFHCRTKDHKVGSDDCSVFNHIPPPPPYISTNDI